MDWESLFKKSVEGKRKLLNTLKLVRSDRDDTELILNEFVVGVERIQQLTSFPVRERDIVQIKKIADSLLESV